MEEEWMTGARYDTGPILNGTKSKSVASDDDGTAILGIESVYNEESRDGVASNHSSGQRRGVKSVTPSPHAANGEGEDGSDDEEEDVMWKCAKCPLEFSDREGVIAHVRAVHKKIHPAHLEETKEEDANGEEAETTEYEIEYVNDADDLENNDDNDNDFDMPSWSPGQDNHSPLPPAESPKSSTSSNRKTRATRSSTTTTKRRGRPPKRDTSSFNTYSPLSTNLSDEEYEVSPVRVSTKKPRPWATPSMCCDICFFQVPSSDALKRHMDTFTFKPRIWKCLSCPKLFMDKVESDAHFEAEHPEDNDEIVTTWSCDSCDRTFGDEYELAHHETFHGVKAPWGCRCCGRTFEKAGGLKSHEHAEVNKFYGGGFKCPGCGEAFITAGELKSHQRLACNNPGTLQCETCEKMYHTFDSLQKHRLTHSTELPWNCTKCGDRFREKGDLSVHLREVHGEDNTSTCSTCGKTFGRAAALRQHELICQKYLPEDDDEEEGDDPLDTNFDVNEDDDGGIDSPKTYKKQKPRASTSSSDKKWRCDQCGTAFSSAASLKQHSQIHASKQHFDCSYCSETFTRQKALEAHEVKRHAVQRKYACRQCPERFVGPAQLKQHILTTHISPNGIFKCTICSKLFSKKEYLQIHSKTHIGERRFKCTQLDCGEVFYSPQTRTQHLLAVHGLTEQVFKCKDCGREFEKQRELERHELTHIKGTPTSLDSVAEGKFKCSTCDKSFLEQFLLTMHQKQHEQTEYKCEHCDKKFKNIASRNIHTKKSHTDAVSAVMEEIVLD